jgi:hypothetical protein
MLEEEFDLDNFTRHGRRFASRKKLSSEISTEDQTGAPFRKFTLEAFIPIRESSEFDYGMFDGMIEQILLPICAQYPELLELMNYGSKVLRVDAEGAELRKRLGAEPLFGDDRNTSRPTAWAVNVGRCRVVYALTSAGKTDSSGLENAWINILSNEIREHAPTHLHTGPFSRLVRNKDVSAQLKIALRVTGTLVHCLESREGFQVDGTNGPMIWDLLVNSAHSEWVATLTRLQTGTIFHLRQGKWPRGGPLPVVGYNRVTELQGGASLVVPDENQREMVRTIIETAASGMSEEAAVKAMSNAGVRSRKPRGRGVLQPLIGELGDPKAAARGVWQHLPTYLSGQYVFRQNNTVPGCTEVLGVHVERENQDDPGHFQFRVPFGIPEGGWHDEETIKLAIRKRLSHRPKEGGKAETKERIKPLTGLGSYIAGGYEYRLMGDDTTYQLRRRLHQPTDSGVFKGFATYDGELVGRFTIAGLHQTVASLLRDLVLEVEDDLVCTHEAEPKPEEIADLLNQANEANQVAARMREFAASTGNPEEQSAYREQASEHYGRGASLMQQHRELLARKDRQAEFADTRQILAAAELLDRSTGGESPTLRNALRRAVGSLRIDAVNSEPVAEVTLTASVRTDIGSVTLGPVKRSILNTAGTKRVKPNPDTVSERNIRLAHDLLLDAHDGPIRDLVKFHNRQEHRRLLKVMQGLLPNPLAASALLDCPIPAVQRIVLNEVFSDYGYAPVPLPDDLDPLWIQEIAAIYLQPKWNWKQRSWASGDATWARRLVSWMHRYHGDEVGVPLTIACDQMGLGDYQIYSLLNAAEGNYKGSSISNSTPIEYSVLYRKRVRLEEPRRIRIVECPHCGTRELPYILRVPELPDGMLCSTCRRPPNSKIVYPEQYLLPWVGPSQGKRKVRTAEQVEKGAPAGTQLLTFRIPPERPM